MRLRNILKTEWKPIFSLKEDGIDSLPKRSSEISIEVIGKTCKIGTERVKARAGCIWSLEKSQPDTWVISTWSKRVRRSVIEVEGTQQDKHDLPEYSKRNRSHPLYSRRNSKKQKKGEPASPVRHNQLSLSHFVTKKRGKLKSTRRPLLLLASSPLEMRDGSCLRYQGLVPRTHQKLAHGVSRSTMAR
jgi:hypothetical protein